jgi:hypothetical protein
MDCTVDYVIGIACQQSAVLDAMACASLSFRRA